MKISYKLNNSVLYLSLSGELDEYCTDNARETLENIFDRNTMQKVVIELSKLDFMDSSGIGVLIGRFKKLKSRQIPVCIANPSKTIDKIFTLSGIYDLMPKVEF